MSCRLQLRFICDERVDFSSSHLHPHLAMLNPGQRWIFKRLASILQEGLPYSVKTSFTFQRLIPLMKKKGRQLSKFTDAQRTDKTEAHSWVWVLFECCFNIVWRLNKAGVKNSTSNFRYNFEKSLMKTKPITGKTQLMSHELYSSEQTIFWSGSVTADILFSEIRTTFLVDIFPEEFHGDLTHSLCESEQQAFTVWFQASYYLNCGFFQ